SCCASVDDNDPKRARNKRRKQQLARGCTLVLRFGRMKEAHRSRLSKRIIMSDHTKTPTNFRDTRLHDYRHPNETLLWQAAQKDSEARRAFSLFVFVAVFVKRARSRITSKIEVFHQQPIKGPVCSEQRASPPRSSLSPTLVRRGSSSTWKPHDGSSRGRRAMDHHLEYPFAPSLDAGTRPG